MDPLWGIFSENGGEANSFLVQCIFRDQVSVSITTLNVAITSSCSSLNRRTIYPFLDLVGPWTTLPPVAHLPY